MKEDQSGREMLIFERGEEDNDPPAESRTKNKAGTGTPHPTDDEIGRMITSLSPHQRAPTRATIVMDTLTPSMAAVARAHCPSLCRCFRVMTPLLQTG